MSGQYARGGAAVAVVSTSSTQVVEETTRSLEEMIFDTSTDALRRAGLTIEDIDGIILSGNDEIDGRVISIMPSAGPAGGVGRDTTMIASSADHVLIHGYLRLLAGQGQRVLVLGWAKPSESVDPAHAELVEAEPYVLRNKGMNHTLAAALQASHWFTERRDPSDEPVAWPLGARDLPARGDSVHGAVLAVEGAFDDDVAVAWILACGWAMSNYELGARNLTAFDALVKARDQVIKRAPQAGPQNWDAVEIAAASEPAVIHAAAALGVVDGVEINGSGRLSQIPTSPHVAGLGRMIAAINAVAEPGGPRMAAGIGLQGFAGQGASVVVIGKQKGLGK